MPFSQNHLKNFDLYHYLYHSHDDGIFFPFCFFMGKSIELLQLCFDLHVFVPFLSNFAWNARFDKFEWRFEWGPKVTYGLWTPWLQFERSRFLGLRRPLIAHDSSLFFDWHWHYSDLVITCHVTFWHCWQNEKLKSRFKKTEYFWMQHKDYSFTITHGFGGTNKIT